MLGLIIIVSNLQKLDCVPLRWGLLPANSYKAVHLIKRFSKVSSLVKFASNQNAYCFLTDQGQDKQGKSVQHLYFGLWNMNGWGHFRKVHISTDQKANYIHLVLSLTKVNEIKLNRNKATKVHLFKCNLFNKIWPPLSLDNTAKGFYLTYFTKKYHLLMYFFNNLLYR